MKIFLIGFYSDKDNFFEESLQKITQHLQDYDIVPAVKQTVIKTPTQLNEAVRKNEMLQDGCDLVLAAYNEFSWSFSEINYHLVRALEWHQPAIVWAQQAYCNDPYLQYMASAILPTLEEAVDHIASGYQPK